MARRASLTTMMRKKLSDITNLQTEKAISQDEKPPEENSRTDKDYIDQLLRERATLIRLVTERNKIVELSGAELQKLRISLQKLQLQNLNLVQSNSRMLAELNLGRDKVKNLEHELQCKNALLKAKDLIIQEKAEMKKCKLTASQVSKEVEEEASHKDDDDDGKTYSDNKRRVTRSRSMGPSTTCQKFEHKEKGETKRRCLRRQSATFRPETENLFEIEEAKFPDSRKPDSTMRTSCPTKLILSTTTDEKEDNCAPRRSSVGRPMRNAATKVQSYKEVPRNIKLRRAD